DERKWGMEFCGIKVYSPKKCVEIKDCTVVIASMYVTEIGEQLRNMGVPQVRVMIGNGNSIAKTDYKLVEYTGEIFKDVAYDRSRVENWLKFRRKVGEGKKNVLFIARSFPPVGGSGVQRPVKFVKYMQNYGWNPIVLSVGDTPYTYHTDDSQLSDIPDNVNCIRVDEDLCCVAALTTEEKQHIFDMHCGVIQNEELMNKYLQESIASNKEIFVPEVYTNWVVKVLDNIEEYVDMNSIDMVYTTMAPYSTAFLGYYIKEWYGIPWVADYRDPWTFNDYCWHVYLSKDDGIEREYNKLLEKQFCRTADYIIAIGFVTADEICENTGIDHSKCIPITNGYDEADFVEYEHIETDKFVVTYNGIIWNSRPPYIFIQAVNELIDDGKVDKCDVEIVFNGMVVDDVKKELETRDVHKIIVYNGYLTHKASLRECMRTNALLLIGSWEPEGGYVYPGKLFEYLRMRVPIIALSVGGSAIEKVLDETGCGRNCEYNDVEAIKGYFFELYCDWKSGKKFEYVGDMDEIEKYSRIGLTKKLVEVFDKCCENTML
ncbi:MAG: glycosyltransferase, partial [Lachnospira sp.]|nr:glycosyltransferase [Lachnospira sp.]